jgi:hypothetical protein
MNNSVFAKPDLLLIYKIITEFMVGVKEPGKHWDIAWMEWESDGQSVSKVENG